MEDCLFCRIVAGEIPAGVEYEDDRVIAIKDLNPQASTHLLVIPRIHYSTLLDCTESADLGALLSAVQSVAVKLGFADSGFRTVINTNKGGGQVIFHLHIHILSGATLSSQMC